SDSPRTASLESASMSFIASSACRRSAFSCSLDDSSSFRKPSRPAALRPARSGAYNSCPEARALACKSFHSSATPFRSRRPRPARGSWAACGSVRREPPGQVTCERVARPAASIPIPVLAGHFLTQYYLAFAGLGELVPPSLKREVGPPRSWAVRAVETLR